jgi:SAM-dependent methyltransferase
MPTTVKQKVQEWLWPLMPGWPDEGRRLVQGPHLEALRDRAIADSCQFRNVLNAGSGEGGYSRLLLDLPGLKTAFESDFGYRVSTPYRLDARQVFFGASLVSIPLANQTMDFVLCTEVLEHIEDHEQALDEICRVISPGGWLLITVPTPPAPPDPAHVREGYREEELGAMLAERGFEVVETRFCMHFFFKFLLKYWWRLPVYCPRILIRMMAVLDRLMPLGSPMDLMILSRLGRPRPAEVVRKRSGPSECVSPTPANTV